MKIILEPTEAEEIFYSSLCNIGNYFNGYGLDLRYDRSQYKDSKEHLQRVGTLETICYEDVLMQILRDGGKLECVDMEGEGDMTSSISMKEVHERISKVPVRNLLNIHTQQDDVIDADAVLQTVFFEEIIFG
jgi:hypothetical protein